MLIHQIFTTDSFLEHQAISWIINVLTKKFIIELTIQRSLVRSDSECGSTSLTHYLSFQSSGSIIIGNTCFMSADSTCGSSLKDSIVMVTLNMVVLLEVNRVIRSIRIILTQFILILYRYVMITESSLTISNDIHRSYRSHQARDTTRDLLVRITGNLLRRIIAISMFFVRRLKSERFLTL